MVKHRRATSPGDGSDRRGFRPPPPMRPWLGVPANIMGLDGIERPIVLLKTTMCVSYVKIYVLNVMC